jgi:hypothetical protein
VDEKLTSSSEAAGGGNGFAGRYSALLDPRTGGPNASLLEDLPPDDLAQLQVGGWGDAGAGTACMQYCTLQQ